MKTGRTGKVTYAEILPIWWSFIWRSVLAGMLAGAIAGAIIGFVAGMLGYSEAAGPWGSIAGLLAGILVSIWALRATINKYFFSKNDTSTTSSTDAT